MLIYLACYLAGALTILSPCILPILPFAFSRAGKPFVSHGLPMLLGMAATFAAMASLVIAGGDWVVGANRAGRAVALVVLAGFGLTLLFPSLGDRVMQPLVRLGGAWASRSTGQDSGWRGSLVLGLATGLLWAPCAGPVLGLVLTGAALNGGGWSSGALLLAYALGAASSLGLALLAGGAVFGAMKRGLGVSVALRRVMGGIVLIAVGAIALGVDTGLLTRLSLGRTNGAEQALLDRIKGKDEAPAQGAFPGFPGATRWINSPPLDAAALRGKVVLVDFWTYSCINCLRSLPYVKAWAARYHDAGLVVVGVHTPEFAFEKDAANVQGAIGRLGVTYPVVMDNDYAIWRAFNNQYWPAHFLIDAKGRIRFTHFGEGNDAAVEAEIRQLLMEAGGPVRAMAGPPAGPVAQGIEAERSGQELSPETYIGYGRAERFASRPAVVGDAAADYALGPLGEDGWGLEGRWTVGQQSAALEKAGGAITFRFRARDVNLVLGPGRDGRPVRFHVAVDGQPPRADHGVDVDAQGRGMVRENRLYQLVRLQGAVGDHAVTITFDDPGVQAFAFTFG